jgi:hypothetical protein
LYGRHCNLYRKLIAIYNILSAKEVVTCRDAFTPMICKQITWAIYDDSRSFFAKRLLPSKFQHREVPFPVSLLDEIYNSVRFINEIRRPTFPPSWVEQPKQEKDEYESQGNGPMAFLSPYGNVSGNQGGRGRGRSGRGNNGNGSEKMFNPNAESESPYSVYCPPAYCDLDTFSPKIKTALKEFHDKFKGKVSIQRAMEAGGIWWPQMPKWDKYYNRQTNQDELCWNQVIGCCRFGPACRFAKSHPDARKIPDDFGESVVRVLKPCIDVMLKDDYVYEEFKPAFQVGYPAAGRGNGGGRGSYGPGGSENKRFRRY